MKDRHLIEIEVDGEVQEALAVLEAEGVAPEQAVRDMLGEIARKKACGNKG